MSCWYDLKLIISGLKRFYCVACHQDWKHSTARKRDWRTKGPKGSMNTTSRLRTRGRSVTSTVCRPSSIKKNGRESSLILRQAEGRGVVILERNVRSWTDGPSSRAAAVKRDSTSGVSACRNRRARLLCWPKRGGWRVTRCWRPSRITAAMQKPGEHFKKCIISPQFMNLFFLSLPQSILVIFQARNLKRGRWAPAQKPASTLPAKRYRNKKRRVGKPKVQTVWRKAPRQVKSATFHVHTWNVVPVCFNWGHVVVVFVCVSCSRRRVASIRRQNGS